MVAAVVTVLTNLHLGGGGLVWSMGLGRGQGRRLGRLLDLLYGYWSSVICLYITNSRGGQFDVQGISRGSILWVEW